MPRYEVYALETIQRRGVVEASSKEAVEEMDLEEIELVEYDGSFELISVNRIAERDEE